MNGTLLGILSFVLVFAAVCLALMIASNLARKFVSFVMLGWMDKLLGTVFGLLKAVLAIGLAIMLVDAANTVLDLIPESTIKESILYAPVKDIANVVYPYLKELIFKK
jgi:membrane protein required for colicin V production